jgi:WD40 repeat protein
MVDDVSFSPNGKYLVSASRDCTASVWEVSTGKELDTLRGHGMAITSARFSPDGKKIATGSDDGTVRFWDGSTGKEAATWTGYKNGVNCNCLSFSHNGRLLFVGYGDVGLDGASDLGLLSARDLATSKELGPFLCGSGPISCLAISPDDAILVTGDREGVITAWNLRTVIMETHFK